MNYRKEIERIVAFIQDYCAKSNFANLVIGLSGGIDSALVAALAVQAIGKKCVFAYNLPHRNSHLESASDALLMAKHLDIPLQTIKIDDLVEKYFEHYAPEANPLRKGN